MEYDIYYFDGKFQNLLNNPRKEEFRGVFLGRGGVLVRVYVNRHKTEHSVCAYFPFLPVVGCTPECCTEIPTCAGICDTTYSALC